MLILLQGVIMQRKSVVHLFELKVRIKKSDRQIGAAYEEKTFYFKDRKSAELYYQDRFTKMDGNILQCLAVEIDGEYSIFSTLMKIPYEGAPSKHLHTGKAYNFCDKKIADALRNETNCMISLTVKGRDGGGRDIMHLSSWFEHAGHHLYKNDSDVFLVGPLNGNSVKLVPDVECVSVEDRVKLLSAEIARLTEERGKLIWENNSRHR